MLNKEVLISFELLDHLSNHYGASAQVKNVTSSIPLQFLSFYQSNFLSNGTFLVLYILIHSKRQK